MSFIGQFAFIMDAEVARSSADGKGFLFGAGIKSKFYQKKKVSVTGYGMINFITESYEVSNSDDSDLDVTEFNLGVITSFHVDDVFLPFIGLDIIPYSDGDVSSGDSKVDIERDGTFNVRIGTKIDLDGINIAVDMVIISENTLTLGVVFPM